MEDFRLSGGDSPFKNAILIAGPTASGKSRLALEVAARIGGSVINADSMQVYDVLRELTARPDARDMARVPHFLYGHVDPRRPYSTGAWLEDVEELGHAGLGGRRAIFVGGTGLYFEALTKGMSRMPDIPPGIRSAWRKTLEDFGPARLHEELAGRDEAAAHKLNPNDGQRIVRALEVLDASGRSILDWQGERAPSLVDVGSARLVVVDPARALLRERISRRFVKMMESGAVEEVKSLLALRPPPAAPAMKAIGVREIAALIEGGLEREEAISAAISATHQYAKRQATWMRNRFGSEWQRIACNSDDDMAGLAGKLSSSG